MLSNHLKIRFVAILKGRFATTCIGSLPNSTSDNSRASAQMTFNRGFAICSSSLRICIALKTDFLINSPRLCVSGLNPHAGENGTIGLEEEQIIKPVIESLKNSGLRINGPVSADSMFTKDARMSYDIAICMYHDQALIPIKTLDFWNSVNVTIGLPIVRTSPDHGTALNLAGSGDANADSMITAIKLAHKIHKNRSASLGFG